MQVSRVHLQVNSPPQLLVLDLYGSIDHNAASVRVDSDGVTFALRKVSLTPTQTIRSSPSSGLAGTGDIQPSCLLFRQRKELGQICCAPPPGRSCLHAV